MVPSVRLLSASSGVEGYSCLTFERSVRHLARYQDFLESVRWMCSFCSREVRYFAWSAVGVGGQPGSSYSGCLYQGKKKNL